MTTLIYCKPAQYDSYMFIVENMTKEDGKKIKTKKYNKKTFTFIKKRRLILLDAEELKKQQKYSVISVSEDLYMDNRGAGVPYLKEITLKPVKESTFEERVSLFVNI